MHLIRLIPIILIVISTYQSHLFPPAMLQISAFSNEKKNLLRCVTTICFDAYSMDRTVKSIELVNDELLQTAWFQNPHPWLTSYNPINVATFSSDSDHGIQDISFKIYKLNNNMACVTFRGTVTTSVSNIVTDLQFSQAKLEPLISSNPDLWVHNGFHQAYLAIRDHLFAGLQELAAKQSGGDNIREIIFTGHSLGGALATLAIVDFNQQRTNFDATLKTSLITFGQPHVGNDKFCDLVRESITGDALRFVNIADIVPRALDLTEHLLPLPAGTDALIRSPYQHYCEQYVLGNIHTAVRKVTSVVNSVGAGSLYLHEQAQVEHSKQTYVVNLESSLRGVNVAKVIETTASIVANVWSMFTAAPAAASTSSSSASTRSISSSKSARDET